MEVEVKSIKSIFDEISSEPGSNMKMSILKQYADSELLKKVLYLALSKRIKFYIKQIPEYTSREVIMDLEQACDNLKPIYERAVTGHDAINLLKVILESLTLEDAYVVEKIILKDIRCGIGTTNINKVIPSLVEKHPYFGAKAYDPKLVNNLFAGGKKCYSQLKADGRFCNGIIRASDVLSTSRQGEETVLTGAKFLNELSKFDDCVLNGELTMKNKARYESNGIIASLISIFKKQNDGENVEKEIKKFEEKHMTIEQARNDIIYSVWDTITVDEYFDFKSSTPYHQRLAKVHKLIEDSKSENVEVIEYKIVDSVESAKEHFTSMLMREMEGTILKSMDCKWKNGKPNEQVKLKKELSIELIVATTNAFNYGTGKNSNLISSINVESSDGLLKTSATGMDEQTMLFVTSHQDELIGKIITVKCSGLSQNSDGEYSVLHPVFIQFRDDKNEADNLQQCIDADRATTFL